MYIQVTNSRFVFQMNVEEGRACTPVEEEREGKSLCCRECFRVVGMFNEAKNSWRVPGTGFTFRPRPKTARKKEVHMGKLVRF